MANPSYTRIDTWNLLDDACRQLAEVDLAGLDKAHELARVKRLMDRIGAYERYWLYPGAQNLATFRAHLESLSTVRLSEEVSLAVRLLSEYGDRTALFDTSAPLADQELVAQAKQQQFYTVLLADDSPSTAPDCLAECLRALRNPSDDVQFEVLVAPSVEDAITAVALNGEIQAAIIRHDLPLRSRDRVPLMNTLLGASDNAVKPDGAQDWVECGEWIRELRPHIDLYLLTDESIAAGNDDEPDVYDRTFYRLNDVTDLHSTVIAGLRNRFATPFFDALRAYASAPVGQFHALPIARGASIFNSKSLQDMGEFYGRNIFMAETSTTSGGLDSLLDPHGNIKKAMDKAAVTWNADHTYFVTNGTSTANKIVVQSLTRPGDIVLIDRNCHKSHHYGLVLAGAYPLYLDAYPLPQFAIYGAVPLQHDQEGAAGPRGDRAAAPGTHAAAHQLHLRRRRLQPPSRHGGGAGDQAGHLLPVGRGVVRVRHRRAVGPATDRHGVGGASRADVGVAGIRRGIPELGRVDGGDPPVGVGQSPAAARPQSGAGPGVRDALDPQVTVGVSAGVDDPRPRPGLQLACPGRVR